MIGQALTGAISAEMAASDYPRFADEMSQTGYDWEAINVTTADDYVLTTFHILGKTGQERNATSAGSVLI